MGTIHITEEQLGRVELPTPEWRLDLLLKEGTISSVGTSPFETVEACRGEDKRRAHALQALPKEFAETSGLDCGCSARMLDKWASTGAGLQTPASATYMRDRRLAILGRILKLAHENSSAGLALISLSHPEWRLPPDRKWWLQRMRQHLERELGNISRAQGFLIAYQHC